MSDPSGAAAGVPFSPSFGVSNCGGYEGGGIGAGREILSSPGGAVRTPISAAAVTRAIGEGWESAGCEARSLRRRSSDSFSSSESRLSWMKRQIASRRKGLCQCILALVLSFERVGDDTARVDFAASGAGLVGVEVDITFGLCWLEEGCLWDSVPGRLRPSVGGTPYTPSCPSSTVCEAACQCGGEGMSEEDLTSPSPGQFRGGIGRGTTVDTGDWSEGAR